MWPFNKNKKTGNGVRDKPGILLFRSIPRVRGDYTLSTSEAIYAAVSRISNTVAMLPMHLYKGLEVQKEDYREKLVTYAPNATMTSFVFQQTMEAFRNTEGNAYAMLVPDASGDRIAAMDVLDASRVTPVREEASGEVYYQFTASNGEPMTVHGSHMLALHHMSANGERGIRPVDVLRGTLDYNRQIKEFSLKQLEGVNSSVVLNIPGVGLSKEKKAELIEQFLDAYQTSGGRVVVLEGGVTATTFSQSPIDSRVLDVERITKNRVATVYNIPPHMLGDYTDTSYSTAEQSMREYLDLTILPIAMQWEQELNRKLLTWKECAEGYQFRFDMSALMRADMATTAEANQKAIRGGWKKPNEVRKNEMLPPGEGGDELMMSRDMVPLKSLVDGTVRPEPASTREHVAQGAYAEGGKDE